MEKNILLTLEYDGSLFHGWQEQEGQLTVQGTLEEALSSVCLKPIKVFGTSRTDAGVHALAQCCNFKENIDIPTDRIAHAVNNMLSGGRYGAGSKLSAIRVLSAEEKPAGFHARFDCKGKKYIYRLCDEGASVFERNYCYFVDEKLDIQAMNEACKYIVGTHDFAAFQSSGASPRRTTVRTISSAKVSRIYRDNGDSSEVQIEICGDGFLYNMVRIVTGTLVEIGIGKRSSSDMKSIVSSIDRKQAGHTAPPCGLYLAEIYFGDLFGQE